MEKTYNVRSAKKTRPLSEVEILEIKRQIDSLYAYKFPHNSLNTNPANYEPLATIINSIIGKELFSGRYICGIYNSLNKGKKSLKSTSVQKIQILVDFLRSYLQDNLRTISFGDAGNTSVYSESVNNLEPQSFALAAGSSLVDKLILKYYTFKEKKKVVANNILHLIQPHKAIPISNLRNLVSFDTFKSLEEIVLFFEQVSIFYQNNRLNISYLCNSDPLEIEFWFNNYFRKLFSSEANREWTTCKINVLSLESLVEKINSVNKRNIQIELNSNLSLNTTSHGELLKSIKYLNSFLDYSWDNSKSYFLMKEYSKEAYGLIQKGEQIGIDDNVDLYLLRQKVAEYFFLINRKKEAEELWHFNYKILASVYNPASQAFKEEQRLYFHNTTNWGAFNQTEVSYCQDTWGKTSIQNLESLTCKSCLLIKYHLFDEAKIVLKECEEIISNEKFDPIQISKKDYHLDMSYGKLLYFEAVHNFKSNYDKCKSLLEVAIGKFNKALTNYSSVNSDHITNNYAHYYLYECYKMLNLEKELEYHFSKFASFFKFHPVSTICHVDRDVLLKAMNSPQNSTTYSKI